MSQGDVRANDLLDSQLGDDHSSRFPATVYAAAYFVAPTDAGGGTEVSGNGYARVAIANTTAKWPDADGRQKTNADDIVFPTPTGDYASEVVAVAIHGHATDDDILHWELLTSPVRPLEDEPMSIPAESLAIVAP